MAATEACAAPVQEDGVTETKSEAEPAPGSETVNSEVVNKEVVNKEVVNKETVNKEVVGNDEAASTETGASAGEEQPAAAAAEEEETPGAEQPAESKAKPAHDGIWDSFLNKSGLGRVMGGKKKREASAEDANAEPTQDHKANGEEGGGAGAEAGAGPAEDQAIEKAPEGEEAAEAGKKEAKPSKQGEKSSVRDLIRKPVARIFSHKSTEKKDAAAAAATEPQKPMAVRSKSLDRLEDPEACGAAATATEEQAADADAQKPSSSSASSSSTKHMKRWHSFKKLMAQRGHKKGSDDAKDAELAEEGGGAEAGGGDSSTLDSKGENSGQKRWKLKRSWTFQGLKRDPSVVGISKAAKGSDKDSTDAKGEEPAGEDGEQAAAGESEEAKPAAAGAADEEAEKVEGEDDKGAAAAAAALGAVSQHANEIWTSFKKRVTPKSKKPAPESAASGEEDGAAAAAVVVAPPADQEQGEEPAAAGKEGKSAKAKRTHFNRAVSLKNFILRKGKSSSVDQSDGAPKEGEEEEEAAAAEGETETTPAGEAEGALGESADQQPEAPVANDHAAEGGDEGKQAAPAPETSAAAAEPTAAAAAEPAAAPPPEPAAPEVTTNGENGCTNGTAEEDGAHNHQSSPKKDEANSTAGNATDVKIAATDATKIAAKAVQGNAVAQSEKKAGNV